MGAMYFKSKPTPVFKGTDRNGQPIVLPAADDIPLVCVWPEQLKLHEQECRD